MDQNKTDLAKKDFQTMLGQDPDQRSIYKGYVNLLDNNFKDAISIFVSNNSLQGLFKVYEKMPDSLAKTTLENIIKQYEPIEGVGYYHFALLALKDNNKKLAIDYFKKSLQYPNKFYREPSYPGNASFHLYKLLLDTKPEQAPSLFA